MDRVELIGLLRRTGCAVERGGCIFMHDPGWSVAERVAADALMGMAEPGAGAAVAEGWLCIRTGGSSGGFRFARHDERTLAAAVEGFCRHYALGRVNAMGVLPPWHISGLMARVRCAATGGEYVDCDWKALEAGRLPAMAGGRDWVISLVPTQLRRLLMSAAAVKWLRRFDLIFLGGGPVWADLADGAVNAGLPIVLSYGMTETAAMVAAQRPGEFLAGDRSSGRAMPHAQLGISPDGRVCVTAESVFRGYFPNRTDSRAHLTDDLGRIDADGRLHVCGRADAAIVTGGKKVQPAEVEAALRDSGEFDDVVVLGLPDPEWGEVVVACYPATQPPPDVARAVAALASYQRPKRFTPVGDWPRNAQGKIDRSALRDAAVSEQAKQRREKKRS